MVGELGDEATDRRRRGLQRHAPRRATWPSAWPRTGAHALLSVTGYYNRPNRRGIVRHYEEVARAAGGTPVIVYNIPSRTTVNLDPRAARRAGADRRHRGGQAVQLRRARADRRHDRVDRQRRGPRALPRPRRRGRHLRLQPRRRHRDAPDVRRAGAPRGDRRGAARRLRRDVLHASPIPVKTALNLLGHDVGGLRLPLVEADESELGDRARRPRTARIAEPESTPRERQAARPPARRRRRDREEPDGRRVRRPASWWSTAGCASRPPR